MTTKRQILSILGDLDDEMDANALRLRYIEDKLDTIEKAVKKAGLLEKKKPGRPKKTG